MRQIDGGAGGGQLLRWAVALSALRGDAVEVENIRGARERPGLRPQHVAAVRAAAAFTDAETEGLETGSESIVFDPGPVSGGSASVDVGTAGSISLVFDTILPLGLQTPDPIHLAVTGGTDVKWAPPIEYHRRVKLPFLGEFDFVGRIDLDRRGFYPNGAGAATIRIQPAEIDSIRCTAPGPLEEVAVLSVATPDLADADVAERQADAAAETVAEVVEAPVRSDHEYADADSTGSSIIVVATYRQSRAGFSSLGEPGKPAEDVAQDAVSAFQDFHSSGAAIDSHLADQLLPFLAIAGGQITTPELTHHIETATELLRTFDYEIDVTESDGLVEISAPGTDAA